MQTSDTSTIYEFDKFRIDVEEEKLFIDQTVVPLNHKTFQVLLLLVQNAGQTVRKEDFFATIWKNSFVEDNNLTVAITNVRKGLGDPQLVETVPRRGYRFKGEVRSSFSQPQDKAIDKTANLRPHTNERLSSASYKRLYPVWLISFGAITFILLLILGVASFWMPPVPKVRKIAVIPFTNLKPSSETDFLGLAFAETINNKLSVLKPLQTVPASAMYKYRGKEIDPYEIAAEQQADTVITGSFQKEGDELQIFVQMLDVPQKNVMFQQDFTQPLNDLLSLEDKVARQIISFFHLTISDSQLALIEKQEVANPEAYQQFVRGLDYYDSTQLPQAIMFFERATSLDPAFARAWNFLGASYAASSSIRLGGVAYQEKAIECYKKAIEANPDMLSTRLRLADILIETNRVEESIPIIREEIERDPKSGLAYWELSYAYRYAGVLDKSLEMYEAARKINPGFSTSVSVFNTYMYMGEYTLFKKSLQPMETSAYVTFYSGLADMYLKDYDSAKANFDKAYSLDPVQLTSRLGKSLSFHLTNEDAKGLDFLADVESNLREKNVSDVESFYKLAHAYSLLGDRQKALDIFRLSVEKGFFCVSYFETDPFLENIRSEPGFKETLQAARIRHDRFVSVFFEQDVISVLS